MELKGGKNEIMSKFTRGKGLKILCSGMIWKEGGNFSLKSESEKDRKREREKRKEKKKSRSLTLTWDGNRIHGWKGEGTSFSLSSSIFSLSLI